MKYFFLFIFLSLGLTLSAQDVDVMPQEKYDLVILLDQSEFKGQIIEYVQGDYVVIQTKLDQPLTFKMDLVQKVLQDVAYEGTYRTSKNFKYNKWYHHIEVGTPVSNEGSFGQDFSYTAIKQMNRWLGFGGGFSYVNYKEDYYWNPPSERMPVYLSYKAFIKEGKVASYVQFNGGYAFNLREDEYKDGWFAYPKLGFKFGMDDVMFNVFLGAHFTQSNSELNENPWGSWEQRRVFRRSTFGLGIMF